VGPLGVEVQMLWVSHLEGGRTQLTGIDSGFHLSLKYQSTTHNFEPEDIFREETYLLAESIIY
jgi:hypothetical protein